MNDWISFSKVEDWINDKTDISISFDKYGLVGIYKNENAHLDIYDMKGNKPDWENGSVECKIEDVKDFIAVFFKDWKTKFEELEEYEAE